MNRLRGNPREMSALLPDLLGQIWGKVWKRPRLCPARAEVFLGSHKGTRSWLSGGLNAAEGAVIPAARVYFGFPEGLPYVRDTHRASPTLQVFPEPWNLPPRSCPGAWQVFASMSQASSPTPETKNS